jgi:hypothetical protein
MTVDSSSVLVVLVAPRIELRSVAGTAAPAPLEAATAAA